LAARSHVGSTTLSGARHSLRAAAPERAAADIETAVDAAVIENAAASIGLTWLLAEIRPREAVD